MSAFDEILQAEDVRVLADLGFMAISRGLDKEAESIFGGVMAARPDNEAGYIGKALVKLYRSELEQAIAILRKLPPTDTARLFLGMALGRAGQPDDARAILSDLTITASGTPAADTARVILDAL